MKKFLFAVLMLAASVAHALDATVTWDAPMTFTDGTPISGSVLYKLYDRVGLINTTTATSFYVGGAAADRNCWTITATVNGQESAHSVEACKTTAPVVRIPSAPTNTKAK